ncbi:SDR family oxidoreductase [Chitinophaga sp. XS-30]|uniref:SDR family oxidoreductase n=1 Tax=Chitinophaga sp. XS-30 TaxID=2604421 RepID=UPI0011DCF4DA|nr:SDR family oxidoreductase [Chitinophaga sp. XS-30]QEH43009.1 SDR family oxidoreductase [Chitinophaga sp. XS-30]
MQNTFKGKTALVTGGSYGIGQATAIAFASRGANVVIADIVEDPEQATAKAVAAAGGKPVFIQCDVADAASVKAMVEKTIATFGRLDFAFNNAGVEGENGNTLDCTEQNWDRTIGVNLKGVWLCMREELPHLLKQGGAIVNCASVAGLMGFPGLPAYVASKHGVVGLTKTAGLEYAKEGVRINAVCPGVIKTAMVDRLTGKDKAVEKQYEDMEPIGRMGKPEEVAAAVVWLCSEEASFVTGHAMPVDGGWLAS